MIKPANDIKRIAIVGPECTGKTHLSIALANHYKTVWVPEYARQYIDRLSRPYEQHDLTRIAQGQMLLEDELALKANRVLICDTNLIVVKVWSEFRYGTCDPEILKLLNRHHYDLLLLTNIDIPWEHDPQREHPDKRDYFYARYHDELLAFGKPFHEITGVHHERFHSAVLAINKILR
jgi:NadR type nicotinamide-nucleotide adenylyltransferase